MTQDKNGPKQQDTAGSSAQDGLQGLMRAIQDADGQTPDITAENEGAAGQSRSIRSPRPAPVHLWNPDYCGEIGLKIASDGTWFYQNSPIGRKALVKLFASVLRKDEDGRHYLVTPVEKIGIEVEDAPFMAISLVFKGEGEDQRLTVTTNMDDEVLIDGDHPLRFERDEVSDGMKPYILVRGRLEALLVRSYYYDLIDHGVVREMGGEDYFGIWSAGQFFTICKAEELSAEESLP